MTKPQNYPQSPSALWNRFYDFTQIPHPSKKEEKILEYIINAAKEKGLNYKQDKLGNIAINLPATQGYEDHPTVIIQNHVDMVCDKTPEREFNFDTDSLDLLVKDGWVCADRTTLGADNGFGAAMAMALMDEKEIAHPPLELLFTVDEETGLGGALGLDASMLSGKKLINLDTEEWGAVYVGCAGGMDFEFRKDLALTEVNKSLSLCKITISNLVGGHSGLHIHLGRANAIKLLAEILWELQPSNFELVELEGGKAHNIIPRDAHAVIATSDIEKVKSFCQKKKTEFLSYLPQEDQSLEIKVEKYEQEEPQVLVAAERSRMMGLLSLFPHGAHSFKWEAEEPLVGHSNNLAIVTLKEGKLFIKSSVRFFEPNQAIELEQQLEALAFGMDLEMTKGGGYPSWNPIFNSPMVESSKNIFKEHFQADLKVKAIHAGLECGILKDKIGSDLEAISIGPNITGAHSPTESLEIDSANKTWMFFTKILEAL